MKIRQMAAALLAAAMLPIPAALASWDDSSAWDPPTSGTQTVQPAPSVTQEPETEPAPVVIADPEADPYLPPSTTPDPYQPPAMTEPETPPVTAEYRITFVADPATAGETVIVREGESLTLPDLPDRQSDGTVFAGWTTNLSVPYVQYQMGEVIYPDSDMTLFAVFIATVLPEPDVLYYVVTYQVYDALYTETVMEGQYPVQVPGLTAPFTGWQDENGTAVNPASVQIRMDRTFTAVTTEAETPPDIPPVNPTPATGYALRTDHGSFMSGYSSGLFQPDVPLTRAHVAKMLYELLANPVDGSASFTDVNGDEWYAAYVRALGFMGLVKPDENGAFRGTAPISRAEFAEILSNFVPDAAETKVYPDVPETHWAYGYIQAVSAAGLFGGDSAGNFNPEGSLTRAQAATVFNRLLGRVPDGDTIRNSPNVRIFPDVPVEYWAYDQIMEATVSHTCETIANGGETWTSISADPSPLADGFYNFNGYLFCQSGGKFLRNTTADGYTYDASGRYTTGNSALDGYLSGILRKVTNSSQTRTEKLRAIFNYVRDNFTYLARAHLQSGTTGWEESYAVDFFERGKGNCFSFAAAFYELARAMGVSCKTVIGTVGSVRTQDHGWVEVYEDGNTWLYDTELEMAYRTRGDYRWNLCRFTYSNAPFTYKKLSVSG